MIGFGGATQKKKNMHACIMNDDAHEELIFTFINLIIKYQCLSFQQQSEVDSDLCFEEPCPEILYIM